MTKKPRIIVIEDDQSWLDIINKLLHKYISADIEEYSLFSKAKERIWEHSEDIDLLITDIFPSSDSREKTGETLAKYVGHANIPVIIITGDLGYSHPASKELKDSRIFHKSTFNKTAFMNLVNNLLAKKPWHSFHTSEVIIYVPNTPSINDQENIVNACGEFMEALGYEIKTEDEPIYNSFYKRLKFLFKKNVTEQDINNLFDKGKKALQLKYVELPTAEQTEKLANATEKLLHITDKFENITIRLGSLLLIKEKIGSRQTLKIHHLSVEEIKFLEENDSILKKPNPLSAISHLRETVQYEKIYEPVASNNNCELENPTDAIKLIADSPSDCEEEKPINKESILEDTSESLNKENKDQQT